MSIGEIVVLTAIVAVFITFGAVLFGVAWYCGRATPQRRIEPIYTGSAHFLVDD